MESTTLPAAAAVPTTLKASAGLRQIYKAAAEAYLKDAQQFLQRMQLDHGISEYFYSGHGTERSYSNNLRAAYREKFRNQEIEFQKFFTAEFKESIPHMFDDAKLRITVFSEMDREEVASAPIVERITNAIAWISFFADRL